MKTEYVEGETVITIELPRERYACSACGSTDVNGRGQNLRRFRAEAFEGMAVFLIHRDSHPGSSPAVRVNRSA